MELENLLKINTYLSGFATPGRNELIDAKLEESSDFVVPVLEDIYQYRNAAAVVRSAEAHGFHRMLALEEENIFNPNEKVMRGAGKWVQAEKKLRGLGALQSLREEGYELLAISAEKEAIPLPDFEITRPVALIFGTEKDGVSKEVIDFADQTLIIPMVGFTESFNISVAAGICFYDLRQKLEKSDLDFRIRGVQKERRRMHWLLNSIRSGEEILNKFLQEQQILLDSSFVQTLSRP